MTNRLSNIPATDFHLEHDPFGRLVLIESNGTRHEGVEPIRAFPVSDPAHGLSLVSAHGRELVWIDDLNELAPALRAQIEAELAEREFVPQIRRIISVSLQTEPCEWHVETDRGPARFVLKTSSDVRRLEEPRAMVVDARGIQYLIPDTTALDRQSRRILERYL